MAGEALAGTVAPLRIPELEKGLGDVVSAVSPSTNSLDSLPDPDAGASDEERARIDRALVRRLDWLLIPWLTLLYLVSFLDRTNIGNAKIDGLVKDLHMTGGQYNAALSLFFVSYACFEPLTNVLLKRLRPSVFLPAIMVAWGVCMMCMGFVRGFSGLAAVRFFLGVAEAGLFPGVNYYLSCWYTRGEIGIRAAVFFSAAAIAGSFGGLLAAAIAQMRGVGGRPGWAWIFILEGLATIVIGAVSYWMVHDFPDQANFLSEADRLRVRRRLAADEQGSARHETFRGAYFWAAVRDWKTYAFAAVYSGCTVPLYAFSLFLPTIIKELGFTSTRANLLSVPVYAAAAVLTVAVGWLADRTRMRGYCNMVTCLLGIAGFSMLLASSDAGVKYAATFLAALGIYPCVSNLISWSANNFEGVYKRGVAMGMIIGYGNLNGVISSNIYRAQDSPRYRLGHGVVLGFMVVFLLVGSTATHLALRAENAKRRAGGRDARVEGKSEDEIAMLGDQKYVPSISSACELEPEKLTDTTCRPDFMYTL